VELGEGRGGGVCLVDSLTHSLTIPPHLLLQPFHSNYSLLVYNVWLQLYCCMAGVTNYSKYYWGPS
jgi:hypothetical protein